MLTYKPVAVLTVHTCCAGAITVMVSSNWPLIKLVALFLHKQGSDMLAKQSKVVTCTVPDMVAVQFPCKAVAITE